MTSCKCLDVTIRARHVITVIAAVFLSLGISVRDSQAYTGICWKEGEAGSCCSEDADCNEGQVCVSKKGVCLYAGGPCDSIFECERLYPQPNPCVHAGICMGGEDDGSQCILAKGYCSIPMLPYHPCNNNLDCGAFIPCVADPDLWGCTGGTCVPCVEGCSIATVTMGSEVHGRIGVLQSFRNKYLQNNSLGKAFITAYYHYSPPVARYIAQHEWLKKTLRILLLPLIGFVSLFV